MSSPVVSTFDQQTAGPLPPDLRPSVDHLVTEDDTPVDNIYAERQQRLLPSSLYASWPGFGELASFVALANVGLFYDANQPAVVPDFLLSLGVRVRDGLAQKKDRSYFIWEFGKSPELHIEVVSNNKGGELGDKKSLYARIGIPLYVVWDPFRIISKTRLQAFVLRVRTYEPIACEWFAQIGLGLTIWHGKFEGVEEDWLRWRDEHGKLLLTGEERAEQEHQRAEEEHQRAEEEHQRAEEERQRADQEARRAAQAQARAEQLAEQLRRLGVEPNNKD
jgi:Uma2 family endonuclease